MRCPHRPGPRYLCETCNPPFKCDSCGAGVEHVLCETCRATERGVEVPFVAARLDEALALLRRVTIDAMGGVPDLFCPDGYKGCEDPWGQWDEDVTAFLAAGEDERP